jgi:hypothetical protein
MKEPKHVQLRGGSTSQNHTTLHIFPAHLGEVSPRRIMQIKPWPSRLLSLFFVHAVDTWNTQDSAKHVAKPLRLCGFMPLVEAR